MYGMRTPRGERLMQVADMLAPYLDIGYRHLIAGFPSPYDEESQTRLATEVRALLERA